MPNSPVPAPGRRTVGKVGVVILFLIFVGLALLDVAALVTIWPPEPPKQQAQQQQQNPPTTKPSSAPSNPGTGSAGTQAGGSSAAKNLCPDPEKKLELGPFSACATEEQRLLLLVLLAGALGGVIHAIRSLGWYVGNRQLVWSWAPWYAMTPLLGSLVAMVFYLVIRGGFFSPQASAQTGDTNAFGFAAFSALIGMFTNQAIIKLKQTFEALLASHEEGRDRVTSTLSIKALQPTSGPQAGGTEVTISGTGFTPTTRVKFGTQPAAKITYNSATEILAVTPQQASGTVDVELVNPEDNLNAVTRQSFTYI